MGCLVRASGQMEGRRQAESTATLVEHGSPLLRNGNRYAADPVNAILNYAYGVLEGQCRTALTSLGFDIACGVLHSDRDDRDSLVYDLMEPLRPAVDGSALNLLRKTSFTYGDFVRGNEGACRLHPQLARYVVAHCQLADANVIEQVKHLRQVLIGVPQAGSRYEQLERIRVAEYT